MKARRVVVAVLLALAVAFAVGAASVGTASVSPMCSPYDPMPCGGGG